MTKLLLLSDSFGLDDVGRPLWLEDGSVVYYCCWALPAQSFSSSSPAVLVTIYCVIFPDCSRCIASARTALKILLPTVLTWTLPMISAFYRPQLSNCRIFWLHYSGLSVAVSQYLCSSAIRSRKSGNEDCPNIIPRMSFKGGGHKPLLPSHLTLSQIHQGRTLRKQFQSSFLVSTENFLERKVNVEGQDQIISSHR
jgi:hypothetical protein